MLKYRAPFVLERPDEAWFDVNMMQKDMQLALELGRAARRADADDRGGERADDGGARDRARRATTSRSCYEVLAARHGRRRSP